MTLAILRPARVEREHVVTARWGSGREAVFRTPDPDIADSIAQVAIELGALFVCVEPVRVKAAR